MLDEWDQKTLKAHQEKVSFLKEFSDLLDKYKVTGFTANESTSNWQTYISDIDVDFENCDDRGWFYINFGGSSIYPEDVAEQLVLAEKELQKFESSLKTQ